MKATAHQNGPVFSCFPETEFEKELFGCSYIVIAKRENNGEPHFVFWYETPDLSHLKRWEEVPPFFNPDDVVELPEEFREALKEELSGSDLADGLTWNNPTSQWENVPLTE